MVSIVEFLEARIGEDEKECQHMLELVPTPDASDANGHDYAYAERVLAECAAKRAITSAVASYSPELEHGDNGEWAFDITLRALAAVYADHPDYRQEWARG